MSVKGDTKVSQKKPCHNNTGVNIENQVSIWFVWCPPLKYIDFRLLNNPFSLCFWWLSFMREGNLMAGTVNLASKQPSWEISRSPPPLPGRGKGVGSVEGEECGQIWAKFGPYIELWVNIPSLCGSHLGKMDPQASPNYAWQAAGGAQNVRALSSPS